jgi:D-tyrosyl-tRNA(Tyr) deacylase
LRCSGSARSAMRIVVQRVLRAKVTANGRVAGEIGPGFLALVGVERGDSDEDMRYGVEKLCGLRVFEDAAGKMNLSIADAGGAILLVSQFTLLGDARHGRRPSFSNAERPEIAAPMVDRMARMIEQRDIPVQCGVFGADMQVELINDGPVTILLDSKKTF